MSYRVYILLGIVGGRAEEAVKFLRKSPGVVMADALEGLPNLIIVMEAAGRQRLAKLAIKALASVEAITEFVQLLPARDRLNAATLPKPFRQSRTGGELSRPRRFRPNGRSGLVSGIKGE